MKKKVISLFLLTSLCLATLVGCNQEFNVKVNTTEDGKTNVDITPIGDTSNINNIMNNLKDSTETNEILESNSLIEDDFDTGIYENKTWTLADIQGAEITINNMLGEMYFVGLSSPAYLYLQFDFKDTAITAEGQSILYGNANEENGILYYYDNTIDKENPIQVYIHDTFKDKIEGSPTNMVIEDTLTYISYEKTIEEDGRIYDICRVTGENLYNLNPITFDMYIDRESQEITKLVKIVDENNENDFNMLINIIDNPYFLDKPSFTDNTSAANEREEYSAYNAELFMALMLDSEDAIEMGDISDKLNVYSDEDYNSDIVSISESNIIEDNEDEKIEEIDEIDEIDELEDFENIKE